MTILALPLPVVPVVAVRGRRRVAEEIEVRVAVCAQNVTVTCSSTQDVTENDTCTEKHTVEQRQTVNMILNC